MKVLVIKTSSLGDILHTLPALTDASLAISGIQFDWVVEEAFAEVPKWHPSVSNVIPVAIRRWRKKPLHSLFGKEFRDFYRKLRAESYDKIIDAQGLIKSAIITKLGRGERVGLNRYSATEKLASLFYQKKIEVDLQKHAVFRMRTIFSQALSYDLPDSIPNYGLDHTCFYRSELTQGEYVVFAHGTTWPTKFWPDEHWLELAKLIEANGLEVQLPWVTSSEERRVDHIVEYCNSAKKLPRFNLKGIAGVLAHAKAVVAGDTGLGHLAAALNVPCVSLYGPTKPNRTGTKGENQIHLVSEFKCIACDKPLCFYRVCEDKLKSCCMNQITPEKVWGKLKRVLEKQG